MNALGPGWGKIILLAIKSCFSKESADQMEKCLNMKKQLAEIVTTANDNTAKKNDNSLNAEKEPPRQQMMP